MDMTQEQKTEWKQKRNPAWRNLKYVFRKSWEKDKSYFYRCLAKGVAEVSLPLSISAIVSLLVATAAQPETLPANLSRFFLLFVVYYGARTGTSMLVNQIYTDANNFRMPIMEEALKDLIEADYQQMDTAAYRARFNEIMESLDGANNAAFQAFLPAIARFCTNLIGIVVYSTLIGSLHPFLIVLILLFSFFNYLYSLKTNQIEKEVQEQAAPYSRKISYLTDHAGDFKAAKDIRLYHMGGWFADRFSALYTNNFQLKNKIYRRKFQASSLAALLSVLRDGLAYWLLVRMILNKEISPASFAFFFSITSALSAWLDGFLASINDFQRIGLQLEPYIESKLDLADFGRGSQGSAAVSSQEDMLYEIKFENVTFTYPEQETPVIEKLNLTIAPGEKIAVVGSNGAGKSTLIKLLCGLYQPDSGDILLNGTSLYALPEKERFALFSAVFQDYYELPYSIEETIRRGQPEKGVLYREALEQSGMERECRKLPQGDQTKLVRSVHLDAVDLSGGQKQKLQLARALYKNGPILVLDEPTAALDPIAENEVYQQYNRMTAGKTSIFISHRLSSTRFCDRIIYMENGKVKETGSHLQLMEEKGHYWKMYQIQSQYYQENYQQEGGSVHAFFERQNQTD